MNLDIDLGTSEVKVMPRPSMMVGKMLVTLLHHQLRPSEHAAPEAVIFRPEYLARGSHGPPSQ